MAKRLISPQLHRQVRAALANIDGYETIERFALRQVMAGAMRGAAVDSRYIETVERALHHWRPTCIGEGQFETLDVDTAYRVPARAVVG